MHTHWSSSERWVSFYNKGNKTLFQENCSNDFASFPPAGLCGIVRADLIHLVQRFLCMLRPSGPELGGGTGQSQGATRRENFMLGDAACRAGEHRDSVAE